MTTRQAAKRLNYTLIHIEGLCFQGKLKADKAAGIWGISEEALREFQKTHKRRRYETIPSWRRYPRVAEDGTLYFLG